MPNTVVRIAENTFRRCQLLNSITVPGCIDFGYKALADCCSLQFIQANGGGVNQFGSATKLGRHLFRDCINLATFVLLEDGCRQELQTQDEAGELPPGCLSSTGITTLELTRDFQVLGAHACDNCKLLTQVDISNSSIEEIQEFTFVHCVSLRGQTAILSAHNQATSHTINQLAPQAQLRPRAFEKCAALRHLGLERTEHDPTNPKRSLPECCFLEAGIVSLSFRQISRGWGPLPVSAVNGSRLLTCLARTL